MQNLCQKSWHDFFFAKFMPKKFYAKFMPTNKSLALSNKSLKVSNKSLVASNKNLAAQTKVWHNQTTADIFPLLVSKIPVENHFYKFKKFRLKTENYF